MISLKNYDNIIQFCYLNKTDFILLQKVESSIILSEGITAKNADYKRNTYFKGGNAKIMFGFITGYERKRLCRKRRGSNSAETAEATVAHDHFNIKSGIYSSKISKLSI